MSDRYRFFSDTNTQLFAAEVGDRGARCVINGWDVRVDDYVDDLDDLARQFGGQLVAQDKAYEATGGGSDAGLQDTASTSVRSNPPAQSRGARFPDYSKQIVSQGGFPPRRATWSQPDVPVLPSGLDPREK
jgi:hypothetical protein